MQTRSQTRAKRQISGNIVSNIPTESIVSVGTVTKESLRKELDVDIDFDEASRAWYMNKKRISNAMCEYICMGKTKTGKPCCRRPIQWQNYCCIHI